ncbi:uncharacterized protein B0P05DRAFT_573449 [Gilbertella persicaria]|uniref:uncharacterized protein n=1 Tax=Gilbertella persicaria TaxID=101096 RepID=UPI00221FB999|nr:uncharacterized protein B0P05DRAFT_573449 [Gilbertella persicaria]KAI8069822.1 hypothetical protein B0P05DRAFT_573449 [Gilbertella persicaria]
MMASRTNTVYQNDPCSDDSLDWSSDSNSKSGKKSIAKKAFGIVLQKFDLTSNPFILANNPIKKPKRAGRKPLEADDVLSSDPKLKRKAQNRAAQRAFRERKEQFVNELQEQMRQLKEEKEKREKELSRENARLRRENEKLKEENYLLRDSFHLSMDNKHKRTGSSADNHSLFSDTGGELSDYKNNSSMSNSISSTPVMQHQPTTEPEFSYTQHESDLFYSKDNLLLTNHDLLLPGTQSNPIPELFGSEIDLFNGQGQSTRFDELDPYFSEQIQSPEENDGLLRCAPEIQKPCKEKILSILFRAKGANRIGYQVTQDVKDYCPQFDVDQLCEELKQKTIIDTNYRLSDADLDLYIKCIHKNT